MTIGWCFDNTYSRLPEAFKEDIKPVPVKKPELVVLNKNLAEKLNLNFSNLNDKKFLNYLQGTHFHQRVIVLLKLTQGISLDILPCWVMVELF